VSGDSTEQPMQQEGVCRLTQAIGTAGSIAAAEPYGSLFLTMKSVSMVNEWQMSGK
jgi:hypothetical protein